MENSREANPSTAVKRIVKTQEGNGRTQKVITDGSLTE